MDVRGEKKDNSHAPSSINPRDDLQSALLWMKKGRVDTQGFAKHLHHTSQDLFNAKVTPENVAEELNGIYDVEYFRWRNIRVNMHPVTFLSNFVTKKALPKKYFPDMARFVDICTAFSADFQAYYSRKAKEVMNAKDFSPSLQNFSILVKISLDVTCEQWAERLDEELFRSKYGSFLQKCPLYGVTPEFLQGPGMPVRFFHDDVDIEHMIIQIQLVFARINSLKTAAKNVSLGLPHNINHVCWECMKVCKDSMVCSRCKAAQYCSRNCQTTAWKCGHKEMCSKLGGRYNSFRISLKTLDAMYSSNISPVINGITLSDEFNYKILKMAFSLRSPYYQPGSGNKILNNPSMKVFYNNISLVFCGKWWFYTDADDEFYNSVLKSFLPEAEEKYFNYLCMLLCYDYFTATREATGIEPSPEVVNSRFCSNSLVMKSKEGFGAAMPAKRFIHLFRTRPEIACSDSIDRHRLRREIRYNCMNSFIQDFHK